MAACGTASGYTQHRRRGEEPCAACRSANAQKKREYLARKPDARAHANAYSRAHGRASDRLIARYRPEFQALLDEELAAVAGGKS
jgi:hypothetical protein